MIATSIAEIKQFIDQHRVFAIIVAATTAAYVAFALLLISKLPPLGSLLVLVVVGAVVFTMGYLLGREYFDRLREKQQIREALVRRLRASSTFKLSAFVQETGIPRRDAETASESVFAEVYHRALADGVVTAAEAATLDRLATAVEISPGRRSAIEKGEKEAKYRDTLSAALSDGTISAEESQDLYALRLNLGLAKADVSRAAAGLQSPTYRALFNRIISTGHITEEDRQALAGCRNVLGLSEDAARALVRDAAHDFFRLRFYYAKQDGRITPEEESELAQLQLFLALSPEEVAKYRCEIDRIKYLCRVRDGQLPAIPSSRLLESGELCHWDSPCRFQWSTASQTKWAAGEIILTNQRTIFASATKSFEFRPAKIIDIACYSDRAVIQTSGSRGTGCYFLNDVEAFVASLEAVTKKQKYLLADGFTVCKTRHIPDHVKQEVWARDGGACVRCGAQDYLEFDHVIPFAKGGANTVANVQLLCRRCNGEKSDRI